jgi:hypothetical protein
MTALVSEDHTGTSMPEETEKHDDLARPSVTHPLKPGGEIKLPARDTHAFVRALLESTPVNERLRETVRRYQEATGVAPCLA